jgi:hypothetical protein
VGCVTGSGIPNQEIRHYRLPRSGVFEEHELKEKPYEALGLMKGKTNFNSLVESMTFEQLCSNYFNKAVTELLSRAKRDRGADALMNLQSVVYYANGAVEYHKKPECSDDGAEGQILIQAQAIRFKKRDLK